MGKKVIHHADEDMGLEEVNVGQKQFTWMTVILRYKKAKQTMIIN